LWLRARWIEKADRAAIFSRSHWSPREAFDWSALSVLITTSIGAPSLSVFLQEGLRNRGVDPAACDCWRGLRLSEARASFSSDLADATRSSAATLRRSRSS